MGDDGASLKVWKWGNKQSYILERSLRLEAGRLAEIVATREDTMRGVCHVGGVNLSASQ